MSTINVQCVDHVLTLTSTPVLSSGSENVDKIQFSFCSQWTDYTKECIFWNSSDATTAYRMVVEQDDSVKIPNTILEEAGKFVFAIRGTNGDDVRTSKIAEYNIEKGSFSGGAIDPPDIDSSVADQILAELDEMRTTYGDGKFLEQNHQGQIKFWIGTQAEYDTIAADDIIPNCYYIITDDTRDNYNARLTAVETEISQRPLSVFQGWTEIASEVLDADVIEKYPLNILSSNTKIIGTDLAYSNSVYSDRGVINNTNKILYALVSANCYLNPASGNASVRGLRITDWSTNTILAQTWGSVKSTLVIPPTLIIMSPESKIWPSISGKNGDEFGTMYFNIQVLSSEEVTE